VAERFLSPLAQALAVVAPGRPLREGLDRILQASMGALVIVGDGPEVLAICSGGFLLDAEFSPQRLSELAKMDGAIILAPDASRIARANVHLVPDPVVPTSETGTRHRTAERVARSLDVPVISVSEALSVIAVYRGDRKHRVEPTYRLINRANQALQTLERYKNRLDTVTSSLSALEIEDMVTVRDVVTVLQRAEMVSRIAEEVLGYLVELGDDGRLISLQLEELMAGVEDDRRSIIRDYVEGDPLASEVVMTELEKLSTNNLLDAQHLAQLFAGGSEVGLDAGIVPRGYRALSKVPRLADSVADRLVEQFGNLQKLMRATVVELQGAGLDEGRAKTLKDSLARLAESSILDRYS
jgi:diadenylate cyclase